MSVITVQQVVPAVPVPNALWLVVRNGQSLSHLTILIITAPYTMSSYITFINVAFNHEAFSFSVPQY